MAAPYEMLGKNCLWALQNFGKQKSSDVRKNLDNMYSAKQVSTELRRIASWTKLGKEFIRVEKDGKKNIYDLDEKARLSHIELLLAMTRGDAFNHHNQKKRVKKHRLNITKAIVKNETGHIRSIKALDNLNKKKYLSYNEAVGIIV